MKIAFVTARVPYPLNAGGRIRTFHLLKEVSQVHQVTLLTGVEGQDDEKALVAIQEHMPWVVVRAVKVPARTALLGRLVRALRNPIDPLPYTWAGYRHVRFITNVQSALLEGRYDLVHCDHVQVAHALLEADTPPRLLNAHNVDSLLIRRVAEKEPRRWKQTLTAWQAWKTLQAECQTYPYFDRCVAVSELDRVEIERIAPGLPVSIVPNGVDVDWFDTRSRAVDPHLMLFTGAMDWLPNVDAVKFFVREVLPLIQTRVPGTQLWVVGRNPSGALVQQLTQGGIRFTGTVDDIRPYLSRAQLVVVPLRIGGGTRLKILEAWAMGKPVLSTSIGAEGLPAVDGANIAIADVPEAMAERAIALLRDAAAMERLGAGGRRTVTEHFAWKHVAEALLQAYDQTVSDALHQSRRTSFRSPAMFPVHAGRDKPGCVLQAILQRIQA